MYQELLYVVSHQLGKRKIGNDEMNPGDLIVYGQKVWFSYVETCAYGMILLAQIFD